jgi:PAS domain S-box-containing protein
MLNDRFEHRKGVLVSAVAFMLAAAVLAGAVASWAVIEAARTGVALAAAIILAVPLAAYALYRQLIFPDYRRLEDTNLELHLKQEELLDIKDDLFIKFLGIYDVNHAANSPRLFMNRMKDVADVTARVMEADACLFFLYDKPRDELVLEATNKDRIEETRQIRIALGEGIEGWVGRRLEPVMLKDMKNDPRFKDRGELSLSRYQSVYCLPLYVYSNGSLVGVMEVLYSRAKSFSDEEINFFTTLSGIISTTVQNEQMQVELRKINLELEQWVSEKTEELRSSEERYRALVENAQESIFVLAQNGDILFANQEAVHLTGFPKYELLHKNFLELFLPGNQGQQLLEDVAKGSKVMCPGEFRQSDGAAVPVEVSAVALSLMGKPFVQAVVRDMTSQAQLQKMLKEKEAEITALRTRGNS